MNRFIETFSYVHNAIHTTSPTTFLLKQISRAFIAFDQTDVEIRQEITQSPVYEMNAWFLVYSRRPRPVAYGAKFRGASFFLFISFALVFLQEKRGQKSNLT